MVEQFPGEQSGRRLVCGLKRGEEQGCFREVIAGVEVRAVIEEKARGGELAGFRSPVQRRGGIVVAEADGPVGVGWS